MDRLPLTPADIVRAPAGDWNREIPAQAIAGLSIDSRSIGSGELFVAIRGDRFDGHEFIGAAIARGARGAVVEQSRIEAAREAAGGRERSILVSVANTTTGLQEIARDVRRRSGTKVVAITGSAGKTTTKEVAAEFLGSRFRVFRNKGNLNNHIGLPLSLLELRSIARDRSCRAGHESSGRNPNARGHRRTGCSCVDQCRRRSSRILCFAGCDCRRQGGDSGAGAIHGPAGGEC